MGHGESRIMKPTNKRTVALVLKKLASKAINSSILTDGDIKTQEQAQVTAPKPRKSTSAYCIDYLHKPKNSETHV